MITILQILFALAPIYVWRFGKTNFLEILVFVIWLIFAYWLSKNQLWQSFKTWLFALPKGLNISILLFLLAAIISVLISSDHNRALGQFIAFFFQPITLFYITGFTLRDLNTKEKFLRIVFILLAISAIYGIIQYFTLIGLPTEWWGNANEPKRALSFFEYPNAFALFVTPLLAYLLPALITEKFKNYFWKVCYGLGIIGLILSLSRGGWYGFLAAGVVFALVQSGKRIKQIFFGLVVAAAIVVAIVPNLRYRIVLPFEGEKSTVSRFSLWQTGIKMIDSSPLLGKGLYGFKSNFDTYNTDPNLSSLNYPHNIFLNFWVETGLLGLISFIGISLYGFWNAWKNKPSIFAFGFGLFLIALYVHGQVDAPYLKNDLALVFWMMFGLSL